MNPLSIMTCQCRESRSVKISYFLIYESSEYSNASQKDSINVAHFLNIQCILYELLSELNLTNLLQAL